MVSHPEVGPGGPIDFYQRYSKNIGTKQDYVVFEEHNIDLETGTQIYKLINGGVICTKNLRSISSIQRQ